MQDDVKAIVSDADRKAVKNTDREIWRRDDGDYYSPSVFVTKQGGIGMNVGGYCIVKPIEEWHQLAGGKERFRAISLSPYSPSMEAKMTDDIECTECCGNGQTIGPNSGEDIICPKCKGRGWLTQTEDEPATSDT